jgi:hypothetical protein
MLLNGEQSVYVVLTAKQALELFVCLFAGQSWEGGLGAEGGGEGLLGSSEHGRTTETTQGDR